MLGSVYISNIIVHATQDPNSNNKDITIHRTRKITDRLQNQTTFKENHDASFISITGSNQQNQGHDTRLKGNKILTILESSDRKKRITRLESDLQVIPHTTA